jgi:hypothetical protein
MAQAQGSSVSLRMGYEPSFGADATETTEIPFIPSLTLEEKQTQNQSNVINGNRDASEPYLGFKSASSSFSVPLDTKLSGNWFKSALGNVDTVDNDGVYTHTFTRHDTFLPSLTLEKAHTDIARFHKGNGFKLNDFTFAFGGEDEAKLDLNFVGQKVTLGDAELVAPSTGGLGDKFEPFTATVTGATKVKSGSIAYSNNLDSGQYVIGDNGVVGDIPLGMVAVTGSFTAIYENDDLLTLARNSTTTSLTTKLTVDENNTVEFKISEMKLEPTGIEVSSPQGIEQTFNFTAFYKAGADNSALTVTLVNDVSGY